MHLARQIFKALTSDDEFGTAENKEAKTDLAISFHLFLKCFGYA